MDQVVVGVRYVEAGPVAYCSPGDLDLGIGDYVVVTTELGERLGWIVIAQDQVVSATIEGPLRVVERIASEGDVQAWQQQRERAQEDTDRAQALATRSDPRVRVASLTYNLAGERGELTYTSSERNHDVAWLRGETSELLGVELAIRQVGDRDRAKALGGVGLCGRGLCCSTWQTEFPVISIRMAKDQGLSPNPSKISGVCGRLLCCLSFEVEAYRELRGDLPKVGKRVSTPAGRAKVITVDLLKQIVRMRMDQTGEVVEMSAEDLRQQYGTTVRPVEVDERVNAELREQERKLAVDTIAILEPVDSPPPRRRSGEQQDERSGRQSAEQRDDRPASDGAGSAAPRDGDSAGTSDTEDRPKRRRRGRRGGRRRRGGGAASDGGTSGGGSS